MQHIYNIVFGVQRVTEAATQYYYPFINVSLDSNE